MARVISLLTVYFNGEVFFRNEPIRNKNCLWQPCLLTDRALPKAMRAFGITWHPSFVVCHLLNFHILIFSSETHQPNELADG
jgi:hypothetical protein